MSKKTQETLGKIIKRPPLTDKLLAKPPFRFLHDIITSVINTTGFMQGLYSTEEQNSDNVKDKESKIAFLQKALDIVSLVAGRQLPMKPSKVVAGHEPEKTNEFLQVLAEAINKQVDNDSYVERVLKSRDTTKSHEPNREKDKPRDKSLSRRSEKERSREKGEQKESSRSQQDKHKEKNENENKTQERDRHKGKEDEKERRRSRAEEKAKEREQQHRGRNEEKEGKDEEKEKDREKEREKDREKGRSEEKSKEKRSSERERSSRKSRKDDTKENEKPPIEKKESDEKIEEPTPRRLQRPTSAKGSRQKREESGASPAPPPPTQDESPKQPVEEPSSQPVKQVQMARPSSARPAPPKQRKSEVIPTDPIIQLGSGRPTNVITDDAQESDEDEQFIVEDNTPLQTKSSLTKEPDAEDETEHGGLVKKILETTKELEGAHQTEKTEKTQVETSSMNNIAYQKQRHLVVQKIEKLQESIQTLTKSANPLGKIMDYIQEDLDSMQKELYRWKQENIQHTMALKHEKEITDRTVEPLKLQLKSLDQTINDQMDVIAMVKANVIRNDKRIVSMLHSVAKV